MKHSTFIRKSKKNLSKDLDDRIHLNRYVCVALNDTVKTVHQHNLFNDIRKLIAKRLAPYNTVTAWLVATQGVNLSFVADRDIQEYRLQWMDSLAEEYERAGK